MSRLIDFDQPAVSWIALLRPVYRFLARPVVLPLFAVIYAVALGLIVLL